MRGTVCFFLQSKHWFQSKLLLFHSVQLLSRKVTLHRALRHHLGGKRWSQLIPTHAGQEICKSTLLDPTKMGQLAHCCWISCWISRMLHPFTSTISRSPPVPFTLSAPASVALPLPVPLVPWHGSPVRKEISYGFVFCFALFWQQLCHFTRSAFFLTFCQPPTHISFTLRQKLPGPAHHSKLKLCPASKPKQLGLVISDLLSGKLT